MFNTHFVVVVVCGRCGFAYISCAKKCKEASTRTAISADIMYFTLVKAIIKVYNYKTNTRIMTAQ